MCCSVWSPKNEYFKYPWYIYLGYFFTLLWKKTFWGKRAGFTLPLPLPVRGIGQSRSPGLGYVLAESCWQRPSIVWCHEFLCLSLVSMRVWQQVSFLLELAGCVWTTATSAVDGRGVRSWNRPDSHGLVKHSLDPFISELRLPLVQKQRWRCQLLLWYALVTHDTPRMSGLPLLLCFSCSWKHRQTVKPLIIWHLVKLRSPKDERAFH